MKPFRIACAALCLALAAPASAQVTVELHAGAGFTAVDVAAWAGGEVNDWEQTEQGGYVQVFFLDRSAFTVGVELGYSYLLWYSVPYSPGSLEYDVDANRIMGVVRREITPFIFTEASVGFYRFIYGEFTDLAVGGAVGGKIPITDALSIPVKLRATSVFDDAATMVPIGFSIGLAYEIGARPAP